MENIQIICDTITTIVGIIAMAVVVIIVTKNMF